MAQLYQYLKICLHGLKDNTFRDEITKIANSPMLAEMYSMGQANEGVPVYDLHIGQHKTGFFALFQDVLKGLAYADYFGMLPVVTYDKTVEYQEKEKIYGKSNVFEYYFELNDIPFGESTERILSTSKMIVKHNEKHRRLVLQELYGLESGYDYFDKRLCVFYSEIINKHIKINPRIQELLENDIALLNDKMIGVHYRGTDFKQNWKGHPKYTCLNDYMEAIERLKGQKKIFFATDDGSALKQMLNKYGDRLCYHKDTYRSSNGLPVHYGSNIEGRSYDRERYPRYKMGYEALRDAITLSKCDTLICGLSQVSFAAWYFKMSRGEDFSTRIVINEGINA